MGEPATRRWCSLRVRSTGPSYEDWPMGPKIMVFHTMPIWCPPTDVFESDECYVIKCAISGLKRNPAGEIANAQVTVEGDVIVIRGAREDDCCQRKRTYFQMEIHYGEFECRVEIQAPFNDKGICAQYRDGFLIVTVPKAAARAERPKRVNVKG